MLAEELLLSLTLLAFQPQEDGLIDVLVLGHVLHYISHGARVVGDILNNFVREFIADVANYRIYLRHFNKENDRPLFERVLKNQYDDYFS